MDFYGYPRTDTWTKIHNLNDISNIKFRENLQAKEYPHLVDSPSYSTGQKYGLTFFRFLKLL